MHFRFMAAIFDLSLPVTSDSTENMDDMSSELNDLGNIGVVFEFLTNIFCKLVYSVLKV